MFEPVARSAGEPDVVSVWPGVDLGACATCIFGSPPWRRNLAHRRCERCTTPHYPATQFEHSVGGDGLGQQGIQILHPGGVGPTTIAVLLAQPANAAASVHCGSAKFLSF